MFKAERNDFSFDEMSCLGCERHLFAIYLCLIASIINFIFLFILLFLKGGEAILDINDWLDKI